MTELVTIETTFWVEIHDYCDWHDYPVQGAKEIQTIGRQRVGTFDNIDQVHEWLNKEAVLLQSKDYWTRVGHDQKAQTTKVPLEWRNEWKNHYRSYIVHREQRELRRVDLCHEVLISQQTGLIRPITVTPLSNEGTL